jgi:hypothetical protein
MPVNACCCLCCCCFLCCAGVLLLLLTAGAGGGGGGGGWLGLLRGFPCCLSAAIRSEAGGGGRAVLGAAGIEEEKVEGVGEPLGDTALCALLGFSLRRGLAWLACCRAADRLSSCLARTISAVT